MHVGVLKILHVTAKTELRGERVRNGEDEQKKHSIDREEMSYIFPLAMITARPYAPPQQRNNDISHEPAPQRRRRAR